MAQRLETLRRLMLLYGGIAEMHSIELQRAAAAVGEAEQAIGVQQEIVRSSSFEGRRALVTGDRMDWTTARTQREIAEWKQLRLQEVRQERELLNDGARRQYIASRLQSEQMKHVVDVAATEAEVEEGRRIQAALDDRFLARRRWTDSREDSRETAR
ncbi:MAG: hypothetical protein ABI380_07255 [Edaphobacter sp.]